jgi:hypothetical protein
MDLKRLNEITALQEADEETWWRAIEDLTPSLDDVLVVDQTFSLDGDVAQTISVFQARDAERTELYALVTRQGLALAAAFVRSAFVYAMCRCGKPLKPKLSEEQRQLLDALEHQDPGTLLQSNEEDVVERLDRLFSENLSSLVRKREDPLSVALRAYLSSPVHKAVTELTRRQAEAWESAKARQG